ncbi:MAG: hypothetical protein KDD10_13105, partial [Phaeodactylibacter sp.]|nr:hypothetical protein [Phaeodactylibacter sp.]
MKNLLLHSLLILLAISALSTEATAQCYEENGKYFNLDGTPCTNTVVSAVPFLRIVADARSG